MAGSIGPTGFLPASEDPSLGQIRFRELVEVFREQSAGPARGRRRPADRRDRAGHPRGQGRDLRHARGVQDRRPQRADPGLRLPAAQRRQDAAGHRHQRRAGDARGAEGRRHRPQLLDRPRGHARRDPLPRRVLAAAGALHPERRHPASGPRRRDGLPGEPGRAGRTCSASSSSATASSIVGGCCGTTPDHIRAIKERCGAHEVGAAPRAAPAARLLDDRRRAARAGARADDRRRARELAGLAQGQGAAAGRRLRRPAAGRRGPGRGRRARARPLRRAHRAPGRGRADAARGQEGLAHAALADPGRLDRARRDRDRAGPDPGPRDRQLGQPRGRRGQAQHASSRSRWRTAPR